MTRFARSPNPMLDALKNLSPRARARMSWAAAPVLASLAILFQYIVDVPKGAMLEREPPKLVGDDDNDDSSDSELDSAKPKPPRPTKKKPQKPKSAARTANQLEQLRASWSARPLEEEPIDQNFRRKHEALLRSVATRARTEALGEREVVPMQIRPTCRTLRCALELCGDAALIDDVAELLPRANVEGNSMWHELREVEPSRAPAQHESKNHLCRRWIVDFALEHPVVSEVRFEPPREPT